MSLAESTYYANSKVSRNKQALCQSGEVGDISRKIATALKVKQGTS